MARLQDKKSRQIGTLSVTRHTAHCGFLDANPIWIHVALRYEVQFSNNSCDVASRAALSSS